MTLSRQLRTLHNSGCEVALDNLTRQLYATDASIYRIVPAAVAFPRTAPAAVAIIRAAAEANLAITPRGAGTGLVGGAIGEGVIVDFARHNQQIHGLNLETRTVQVGAGVVLDQLNAFLRPYGFCFGPDVATSSRATLGGMIANNSSGARAPLYGTTADHVVSVEVVTADGRIETLGPNATSSVTRQESLAPIMQRNAAAIAARMPAGLRKRWPGYGIDRFLKAPGNLAHLLAGSEGTLAGIFSAELKIVPLPREKGLGLIFFTSLAEALQAAVELLELKPAAIEHIDRVLLDQTRGQRPFQAARDLLELDVHPCESLLIVELYEDVAERMERLRQRDFGSRTMLLRDPAAMNLVWGLRKAGLSLLTSRAGPAKPATCIEDTAVRPEQLPDYVRALQAIMKPLELEVCYYGHAAAGLLHVRPVLDLHSASDLKKLRHVSDEVASLVRQFGGSLAAEHGVGMARTEYMREQLGPELMAVMQAVKAAFDPANLFNPGKILDDGRFKIDRHLRLNPRAKLRLPFEPVLGFVERDGSFIANLEQCNGCGGCRKAAPTMCPTFVATGDELMSTRGRANLIRAVLLERAAASPHGLQAEELSAALKDCLACKACATECPSHVNMALLKAELLHARHQRYGLPLRERLFSTVDLLGAVGCSAPTLANAALRWPPLRQLLSKALGIAADRPLPCYAPQRFDDWFNARARRSAAGRGPIVLWDDTFVRYHEPHIGMAAVRVLEAAGFDIRLAHGRRCCGRPAFSQGRLHRAGQLGRHNLALLRRTGACPIVFLEPSCYSMFVEDYRELQLPGADEVAARCFLFEQFMDTLLMREPNALSLRGTAGPVAIHAHCHAKALSDPAYLLRLAQRVPSPAVTLLQTGCCGMAGAYGTLEANAELSRKVAEPLLALIRAQPPGSVIVASGTSCRQQIEFLAGIRACHMAELLASSLSQAS